MTRQKKCYSGYDELAHAWVHSTDPDFEGYTRQYRMFAERCSWLDGAVDNAIYSYGRHFCIARKTRDKKGKIIMLFNAYGYSNTTATHKGAVSSAIPRSQFTVFTVPDASLRHSVNIKWYLAEIESNIEKAIRATKHTDNYLRVAESMRLELVSYMESFKTGVRLKKAEYSLRDTCILDDNKMEQVFAEQAEKIKKRREAQRKANAEKEERRLARIERWKTGEIKSLQYGDVHYDEGALLRLSEDGSKIETSHGADMEYNKAKILYKLLESGKLERRYDIYTTKLNGDVLEIGCHKIKLDEIRRLALTLKWEA